MHYALCDLIADLTQNAVEAGSSFINVDLAETEDELRVSIKDNGKGMSAAILERAKDPFYTDGIKHPKRKVGLGIPFLIQTTEETGGTWDIQSCEGKGTKVFMSFNLSNVDTPPLGSVPELFRQLLTFDGDYNMEIMRKKDASSCSLNYRLLRSDLREVLGGMKTAGDLVLLGDFLQSQETD